MEGINYVTDDKGRKIALMIDLKNIKKYTDEDIEDIEDLISIELRKNNPKIDYRKIRKQLIKKGILSDEI